jgi:hypothetical protein
VLAAAKKAELWVATTVVRLAFLLVSRTVDWSDITVAVP